MTSQVQHQENLLSDCLESLQSWKFLIEEHLEGEDKTVELNSVKEILSDYCQIEFNARKSKRATDQVSDYFGDDTIDHSNKDVEELYKEYLAKDESTLDNIQQSYVWQKVMPRTMNDVEEEGDVEEVQQTKDETLPETAYEEMYDSIFCASEFAPLLDPLSKAVIEEPYKSKNCGHVYEHKYIIQYIKSMKSKAKCPYMGCINPCLTIQQLVPDLDTQMKTQAYLQSQPSTSAASESTCDDAGSVTN